MEEMKKEEDEQASERVSAPLLSLYLGRPQIEPMKAGSAREE